MDTDLFLQNLRDISLEEGKVYIQKHIDELSDHAAVGNLLADEALRQLYINPIVSLKLAELLTFFGEYVQYASSHALGLKAKGDALEQIGHHQAAIECLDAAGEEFLYLRDEGNWARSRISWVIACASLGHVEEALKQAAHAREIFLKLGEHYWVHIIDHNTAWIYEEVGRFQDALKLYEDMLGILPTLTDQDETYIKRAVAMARMNQANNLSWLGMFEQAYRLLELAQSNFIELGMTSQFIGSEIDLVSLNYTQGYYGSALKRYYQARDRMIQDNIDHPLLLAELQLWIANCLVKLNREQDACLLMGEAVQVYRQLGTSLQASNALREYATILVASGRLKEALATLEEASILFDRGGFHRYASFTQLQQAELLLKMGFVDEAYDQACHIRKYFEFQGLVARSVQASLIMAGALIEKERQSGVEREELQSRPLQEAVSLCEWATRIAHQYNLQEQAYKSQYLLGRLALIQGEVAQAAKRYRAAITQIEHILSNLVYDLSPSFLYTTWAVYEDMIALCLQRGQGERAFSYLERARSMALRQYLSKSRIALDDKEVEVNAASRIVLQESNATALRMQFELRDWQERYHDYNVLLTDLDTTVSPTVDREVIHAELKRCETKINELFERLHLYEVNTLAVSHATRSRKRTNLKDTTRAIQQIDMEQLRQHLSPNQLLLAYYLYKGNLVTFAITSKRLITYENPGGGEQLERLLPLLHAHLNPRGWSDFQSPPMQSILRLLNKLYDLLVAPVESLLPSQPGHLTIVPFGPLHGLPFHALYDGSHYLVENFQINYLPACNILTHLDAFRRKKEIHPVENGVYDKLPIVLGYSENGLLQRVRDEAQVVAALLHGNCYLEEEATISRLIEQAPGSPIIHLATHGRVRLDAPNFSYLRLADGHLNSIDAFSLNLRDCELVTLSGCETGLSLSGGGDEQLGLGRAFLTAGAASLVMSLWPVEDASTNELMRLFYQNLLKGDTKAEALRAAQCQLLHRTSPTYTHPYFWAAFRLVGDIGPLMYNRAEDHTLALKTEALKG